MTPIDEHTISQAMEWAVKEVPDMARSDKDAIGAIFQKKFTDLTFDDCVLALKCLQIQIRYFQAAAEKLGPEHARVAQEAIDQSQTAEQALMELLASKVTS